MSDLPIEKELTHFSFCLLVAEIKDVNVARQMLEQLHLKYLANQAAVSQIAKQEFLSMKPNGENHA